VRAARVPPFQPHHVIPPFCRVTRGNRRALRMRARHNRVVRGAVMRERAGAFAARTVAFMRRRCAARCFGVGVAAIRMPPRALCRTPVRAGVLQAGKPQAQPAMLQPARGAARSARRMVCSEGQRCLPARLRLPEGQPRPPCALPTRCLRSETARSVTVDNSVLRSETPKRWRQMPPFERRRSHVLRACMFSRGGACATS